MRSLNYAKNKKTTEIKKKKGNDKDYFSLNNLFTMFVFEGQYKTLYILFICSLDLFS